MAEQVIRVDFHVFSQKLTTYARSAAALEAYWAQRAAAGSAPVGPSFPGGEKALAYKTREACELPKAIFFPELILQQLLWQLAPVSQ